MAKANIIKYNASPTCSEFHNDKDSLVRIIRGCIGSGKSVACVTEIMRLACSQAPDENGIRPTRIGVVRNTYPELKSTVIKTFQDWIPDATCRIVFGSPITGMLKLSLPDGTKVECEVIFLSLDKPKDIQKLLSFEFTFIYFNEVQFIQKNLLTEGLSRCGRYPSKRRVACTRYGVFADTNSYPTTHYLYDLEMETPERWKFYRQPSALLDVTKWTQDKWLENKPVMQLMEIHGERTVNDRRYVANPRAENAVNHSNTFDYWLDLIGGNSTNWIKSRVLNQFATVIDGMPIYNDSWRNDLHVSNHQLSPVKRGSLVLGFDFGVPACIIAQLMPNGQLRILDELTESKTMGIESFMKNIVLPVLNTKYKQFKRKDITVFGDPAGKARAQTDLTAFMVVESHQLYIEGTPTNNPDERWDAVRNYLGRLVTGGQPAFLVDQACKFIITGFDGEYKFRKMQVSGDIQFSERAEKNAVSHPHDALQYLCYGLLSTGVRKQVDYGNTYGSSVGDSITGY